MGGSERMTGCDCTDGLGGRAVSPFRRGFFQNFFKDFCLIFRISSNRN